MPRSTVVDPSDSGTDLADPDAELAALRAYLATMPLPPRPREARPPPVVPFEALPSLPDETRRALETAALEANDRYLETFLEPSSFCPFSRGGRQRGLTHRVVHYTDAAEITPLLDHMAAAARDPNKVVVQIILPLIETSAEAWSRFCHELTAVGNELLRDGPGAGAEIFAVAPLHPALAYTRKNPLTLIPLFRRTPDPTIQWVRLDALKKLYQGRSGESVYVDPADLESFLAEPHRRPLFDRIAETNMMMAERLGVAEIERALRELSRQAQERYARILLSDAPSLAKGASGGCPHHARARTTDTSPPHPAILERDGRWALVRVDDLEPRVPRRFLVHDVEVVAIRADDDIHVLHARCPHRHAPLTDATVEGDRLVCPHHGWDFELASGRSQGVPGAAVARFRARVDEGMVWVEAEELEAWRRAQVQVFLPDDDVL